MKKLALLMFTTLILGCGTETTVVEEPEPVIQEHTPTVASGERFRFSGEVPQIVWGYVRAQGLRYGFGPCQSPNPSI